MWHRSAGAAILNSSSSGDPGRISGDVGKRYLSYLVWFHLWYAGGCAVGKQRRGVLNMWITTKSGLHTYTKSVRHYKECSVLKVVRKAHGLWHEPVWSHCLMRFRNRQPGVSEGINFSNLIILWIWGLHLLSGKIGIMSLSLPGDLGIWESTPASSMKSILPWEEDRIALKNKNGNYGTRWLWICAMPPYSDDDEHSIQSKMRWNPGGIPLESWGWRAVGITRRRH